MPPQKSAQSHDHRQQRLGYIVDSLVRGKNVVDVKELAERFQISERAARDDMNTIHAFSQLRTGRVVRGTGLTGELYHDIARARHISAKLDVGAKASEQFDPASSIAASPGTTVAWTYAALTQRGKAAVIVTNSFAVVEHASARSTNITLVGGLYDPAINAVVGPLAEKGFRDYKCRDGLLGVSGITADGTLYVHHDQEVSVLEAMLAAVQEKLVIVADIHKVGRGDPWIIGSVRQLATDRRQVIFVTNDPQGWRSELGDLASKTEAACDALRAIEKELGSRFQVVVAPRDYVQEDAAMASISEVREIRRRRKAR